MPHHIRNRQTIWRTTTRHCPHLEEVFGVRRIGVVTQVEVAIAWMTSLHLPHGLERLAGLKRRLWRAAFWLEVMAAVARGRVTKDIAIAQCVHRRPVHPTF